MPSTVSSGRRGAASGRLDGIQRDPVGPLQDARGPPLGKARDEPIEQLAIVVARSAARATARRSCAAGAPGRASSSSSGRARVMTRIGRRATHSTRWSMKSRRPVSAQWRSSNTRTTVPCSATRSKNVRHAAKSSSRSPPLPSSTPEQLQQARLDPAPLPLVGHILHEGLGDPRPRRRRVVGLGQAGRLRTISPSAQNVMPSPYAGERPWCQ